ncbi:MAG: toll/interleukin-1 receptor domain-containing protein [Promethearchaeota archaeon]
MGANTLNIWISYATEDHNHLESLISKLDEQIEIEQKKGNSLKFEYFYAPYSFRVGEQWYPNFQIEVNKANAVILLLSQFFVDSRHCNNELTFIIGGITAGWLREKVFPLLLTEYKAKEDNRNYAYYNEVHQLKPDIEPIVRENEKNEDARLTSVAEELVNKYLIEIASELKREIKEPESFLDFDNEIVNGRFTPFIGPLIHELPENYELALPYIYAHMQQLIKALDNGKYDKITEFYVRSIVNSQIPIDDKTELNCKQRDKASFVDPDGLIELQKGIARAGALACKLFGEQFNKSIGLTDTKTYKIFLSPQNKHVKRLADYLVYASLSASKIPENESCSIKGSTVCLGAQGIARKLAIFIVSLFGKDDNIPISRSSTKNLEELWNKYKPEERNEWFKQLIRKDKKSFMSLSQLEWLGDLLWHTMRFDAPMFPTPNDFVFQLSLCGENKCLTRVSLNYASALHTEDQESTSSSCASKIIRRLSEQLEKEREYLEDFNKTTKHPVFYEQIAKLLSIGVKKEIKSSKSSECVAISSVNKSMSEKGEQILQPLVITSNLDDEIERYLKLGKKVPIFYVIYPVSYEELKPRGKESKKQRKPIPAWVLCENNIVKSKTSYYHLNQSDSFPQINNYINIRGPIVVKLRGSPLNDEPPKDKAKKRISLIESTVEYDLRFLLSSLDFIRELWDNNRLPQCIRDLLQEKRILCFMGYPLEDPDSLLGLYSRVWVADVPTSMDEEDSTRESNLLNGEEEDSDQESTKKSYPISIGDHRDDGLGPNILKDLDIKRLPIDLEEVAEKIAEVLKYIKEQSQKKQEEENK